MNLLQNTAGNFLNMTPDEARSFAAKLIEAADKSLTAEEGRGGGFVQTIVIREHRLNDVVKYAHSHASESRPPFEMKDYERYGYGEIDTIFVGISPSWTDIHPTLEAGMQLRSPHTMNIDLNAINPRLKKERHQ